MRHGRFELGITRYMCVLVLQACLFCVLHVQACGCSLSWQALFSTSPFIPKQSRMPLKWLSSGVPLHWNPLSRDAAEQVRRLLRQ